MVKISRFNRDYRYDMGFAVNGNPLPDPSTFGATVNSLDSEAERDASGHLHRNMVATKHTFKMGWNNIEWQMVNDILSKVNSEYFSFTAPDPLTGKTETLKCYVGDRSYDCVWSPGGEDSIGNLSFNVIEY